MKITFEIHVSLSSLVPDVKRICEGVSTSMHEFGYDQFSMDITQRLGKVTLTLDGKVTDERIEHIRRAYQESVQENFPKYKINLVRV
jgi:hypothetical protein